jgi:hypothetical protein
MNLVQRAAVAALVGGLFFGGSAGTTSTVSADDETYFAGCITNRTDTTITMNTSAQEVVTIDTTWLKQDMRDILLSDCVTVNTVMVDGKYMAQSVEEGDEKAQRNRPVKDDENDHDSNSDSHDGD